jgi:hypothetical protein
MSKLLVQLLQGALRLLSRPALPRSLLRGILVLWGALKRLLAKLRTSNDFPRPLDDDLDTRTLTIKGSHDSHQTTTFTTICASIDPSSADGNLLSAQGFNSLQPSSHRSSSPAPSAGPSRSSGYYEGRAAGSTAGYQPSPQQRYLSAGSPPISRSTSNQSGYSMDVGTDSEPHSTGRVQLSRSREGSPVPSSWRAPTHSMHSNASKLSVQSNASKLSQASRISHRSSKRYVSHLG